MSGERAHIMWRPLAGGAALILLVAASLLYGISGAPGARAVPIAIAGVQIAIVALMFMQLARAGGLVRLAAITGIVWASFLFLFTFADLLTR